MLDGNEKILCAVPSKDIISLYQNLNYHQADTIEGSLVLSEKYTSILSNVRYFAISDRESNHNFYLYRKTLVQVQNHEIAINGQGAFWDEMQGAYIKDKRPNQVTPADTIKLILSYSRWNVDYVDQMLEEESLRRDMNFYYVSLLDALNTVYQTWQVDIEPYINIEGHQITRRYVKLYQQQGGNNGRRFVYGDNALTVTQQANEGSIFTALVGRGAGVEETDASGNLTGGYSRKISFADVEWSKANGDPCDKPKGQEYVEWKESTELYGYSDGKPRIGIVNFDNEKDPAQLLKETWAQLQQVGVPLVQFQATVGDVGYLNLGETVTIVRYDLNIKYQTRVTGIKWNRCDEAKSQITIGVKAIQSTADKIAGLQQSVAQANVNADEAKSTANHAIIDGTGAVVNYGPNEPTNPKEGDIWYDVQPDGTVVLKQYQNGQWVILIDDTTGQQIKNKVEAQQKELDQAVQDANAASAKADGLVAQVGDANTNAQKALTAAQQNKADLAQAKNDLENTKSQLTNVQSDLTGTKSSLAGAISNISQAKAELEAIKSQAAQQGQTIVNIEKSTDSLSSQIADVKGNVTGLQQTATSLQSAVEKNKNDISVVKQTAEGVESTVTNMKISSANLLPNTLDFSNWESGGQGAIEPASQWNTQTDAFHGWIDTAKAWIRVPESMAVYLEQGKQYTYSAKVWNNGSNTENNFDKSTVKMYINSPSNSYGYTLTEKVNHTPRTYAVTFTAPETGKYTGFNTYQEGNFIGGSLWSAEYMLVEGNVATAYQPSSQDMAKNADISTIKQDITGLEATVKSNSGNISDLKLASDKLQSTIQSNSGQISQVKQTADSLQSAVTNNSNDISTLKQTATGLQSTVSNMKISSENLLPDTLDFAGWQQGGQGNMDSAQADNTLTNAWHAWGDNNSAWIGSPQAKPVYLSAGMQYTFSAVCWNYGSSTGNNFDDDDVELYFNNNDNSKAYNHQLTSKTNKEHVRYSVTFTVDTNGLYWGFKLIDKSGFIGGSLWSAEYMLVEGNIATAYQPSATAMATNISTIQQTIDGVKIDVANSKGDISSLKQRADSMESNISDNKNDISDLRQTANSLQSNIQNKADISQITQLSNAIQSVVQSVGSFFPNGNFADSNIQAYWSPWDITKDYTNITFDAATYNGSFGNLLLHASGGGWTKAISTEYIPVQPSKSVTVSLASRGDWYGNNGKPKTLQCYVHFYDSKKNETASGSFDLNCSNNQQWYNNSASYDCSSNECYVRIEIILQGNQENWAHITNVKVSSDGGESISSKISQMADDINMRVQKGDLLSQINIQAGKTLIQSNKLYLDASSVVFSGSAFIPSAAITDLSADKITTGTLNAANVHVINMDIANLVGDKTSFVRSQWQNAYGAYVNIDGGGMSVGYGNWFTKFDGLGMTFKDGGDDLGGFTRVGMVGAPSWYGGLAFNAGGDAEFLSIGAKDYHNDNQNPVPSKLLWARQGIDTYGYRPGWNFGDDVWTSKIGIDSIQYGSWNIHFGIVVGDNNFSALTLTSGIGNGFYWGSDGSFGYVTGGNALHNVKGSQIVYSIGSDGTCHSWGGV